MRLAFTPFCISVERLELINCVCRQLVCKSCNKPCDTGLIFTGAATAFQQRRTLKFGHADALRLQKFFPTSTESSCQYEAVVHELAVTSGIDHVTASCCSLEGDMLPVTRNPSPLKELVVENAQHESHCSRFFTVVTAPFAVQSTASTSSRPTYS